MPTRPLSDEECLQAVAIRNKHRTLASAAQEAGVSWSAFENRLRRAAERGLDGSTPAPLPLGQRVKGVSTLWGKGPEGWEERLQWVKTKDDESLQKLTEALIEAFDTYKGKAELINPPKEVHADLLSVYPIADQHVGLLAWGKETGQDYDLEIGSKRLRDCAGRLISQSPASKQAIILNLGDYFHIDDSRNETPSGHNALDADGRYIKVLVTGVQLMQDVIEMALQKHESVVVRNLPGNHDPHASVALTVALGAFYSKNPRVVVDADPSEFFFHRFGQVLLGANHGHRVKAKDMALLMADRQREAWGQTKFHYMYFGHIHHETAREEGSVRIESFQTLTPKDAWSTARGYLGGQSITSITHHIEDGEVGRHRVNI